MAWPVHVMNELHPLQESLATKIFELANLKTDPWQEVCLDLEAVNGGTYSVKIVLRDFSRRQTGSIVVNHEIDSLLRQIWNVRQQLSEIDAFKGLRIAITADGECNLNFSYANNGEVDEDSAKLLSLYHKHVAYAFDLQLRMSDFLESNAKGAQWNYTVSEAKLIFGKSGFLGKQLTVEGHLLGSYASPDMSWLWAWNNPHMNLTAANAQLKDKVQSLGTKYGINLFTSTSQVAMEPLLGPPLVDITPDVLAMIVSRELNYQAYYKSPFDHGAAAIAISDNRLNVVEEQPLIRISTMFLQVVSAVPVLNHREAFIGYCRAYGLSHRESGDDVTILGPRDSSIIATFDGQNRMTKMNGNLK